MDETTKKKVREMRGRGASFRQIADECGVSLGSAYYACEDMEPVVRKKAPIARDSVRKRILRDRAKDPRKWTYRALAEKYGMSREAISLLVNGETVWPKRGKKR